jgi:hypothetical protein
MAKRFAPWLILCVLLCTAQAGELLSRLVINNKIYFDVRWGPINNGKVVMFHSRGMLIIPLADLPSEYQDQFGYKPPTNSESQSSTPTPLPPPLPESTPTPVQPPAPTPTVRLQPLSKLPPIRPPTLSRSYYTASRSRSTNDRDWQLYNVARQTKVIFEENLVDAASLTPLVGFIGNPGWLEEDGIRVNGTFFELAEKRKDAPEAPSAMLLRPHLWRKTGTVVFLKNYKPETEADVLVRLYVSEQKPMADHRTFEVATEPTFEQWLKLRNSSTTTLNR